MDDVRVSLRESQGRLFAVGARAKRGVESEEDLDAVQMPVGSGFVKRDPSVERTALLNVGATLWKKRQDSFIAAFFFYIVCQSS